MSSHKSVLQECLARVSKNVYAFVFEYVFAFGFVGSIFSGKLATHKSPKDANLCCRFMGILDLDLLTSLAGGCASIGQITCASSKACCISASAGLQAYGDSGGPEE